MALVARRTKGVSMDTTNALRTPQIAGELFAGEALLAFAACYIASTGLVMHAPLAIMHGVTPRAVGIGEPVTLFLPGVRATYAESGLTPGAKYFANATGGIDTATQASGDALGWFVALNAQDLLFVGKSVA